MMFTCSWEVNRLTEDEVIREDHEMIGDDQLRIGITIWVRIRIRRMCGSVDRVGGWITLADLGK